MNEVKKKEKKVGTRMDNLMDKSAQKEGKMPITWQ